MIRRAAAIALALTLNPAHVRAQDTAFTVTVQSADVYKGPSNVTPVIGHVSRGRVLPISRNLGSWVKIAWPEAPDGFGYVRVTMGRIGPYDGGPVASAAPKISSAPATTTPPPPTRPAPPARVAPRVSSTVMPASHLFGVGGMVGTMRTFGATARAWSSHRVGIQVGFTRDAITSADAASRATATQFEPGVVYSLFDHVSDYVWIRPYVGSVVSFRHQTLGSTAPSDVPSISDNGVGFRFFGGSELTFAGAPRFGLSLDVGYRRFPTLFPGFEADPVSVTIAGHWYIK